MAIMTRQPRPNDPTSPLVSVLVFNYNYGCYLGQCLDSVLAQTYGNIEILFSDNASTDDSWRIALEYQERHPGLFFLARNRQNFGTGANLDNVLRNARGKYFVHLCSDDALLPDFVATTVAALEAHLDTGFAMVHRAILDEHGQRQEDAPFYNQTCKIPGAEQAAVYMMAAVNPAMSQIMYRRTVAYDKRVPGTLALDHLTRLLDFTICLEYPIIYILRPLILHRMHGANDSFRVTDNLMEVIGPYALNHQFAQLAAQSGHDKAASRLPMSIEKLARLALRYCVRALIAGNERNGARYFHLAAALWPEIGDDALYVRLGDYWQAAAPGKAALLDAFATEANLVARSISYDPPPGSIPVAC
jgi:glycosyltransferase involved in cell wall biosynthesis